MKLPFKEVAKSSLIMLGKIAFKIGLVSPSARILTYHSVADAPAKLSITPETFEKHMNILKAEFSVISLEDLVHRIYNQSFLGEYEIIITFDDGYKDNYINALPILRKYNLPATFFITTGFIGRERKVGGHTYNMMDWNEVLALHNNGFTIGAHTVSHPNLAKLSKNEIKREVSLPRNILGSIIGKPVKLFAYPFGEKNHINDEVIELTKEAGYECGLTTTGYKGLKKNSQDLFTLGRTPINDLNMQEFKNLLCGIYDPYFTAKEVYKRFRA